MPRTLNPDIDQAIASAAMELLGEQGFATVTMEAIATRANVGKPALYRRFSGKAELVASVIAKQLHDLDVPDLGDTEAELRHAVSTGFPDDGPSYVGLIGGLMAERDRHPELIEAFRKSVLLPRRAIVAGLIERGQRRGDIRRDIGAIAALDLFAGPFLARVFAGEDTSTQWRDASFETWWSIVKERAAT